MRDRQSAFLSDQLAFIVQDRYVGQSPAIRTKSFNVGFKPRKYRQRLFDDPHEIVLSGSKSAAIFASRFKRRIQAANEADSSAGGDVMR